MLTVIVFREFYAYVVDLQLRMTNKALSLLWQWKGVLLNCSIHVPMTRFLHNNIYVCQNPSFSNMYVKILHSFSKCRVPLTPF